MSNLDHKSPKVYQDFMAGYHVLRQTEGHTLGDVSPDHVIEQTLMRSLKSAGGFTRGTGFEDVQRHIYVLPRPSCAEVSTSIEELTDTKYISSDQHKSSSNS